MHLKAVTIELDQLKPEEGATRAKMITLVQEKTQQDAAKPALDARIATFNAAEAVMKAKFADHKKAADAHMSHYVAQSTDANFVRQYNQKAADLNAWEDHLNAENDSLSAQRATLSSDIAAFKAASRRNYDDQVQNHKDIEALKLKKAELIKDFNRTIDAILKLKNTEVDCSKIPGIGNLDLTTLDGASERAKACLGKGFDTR
jgi:DNA repair exonuclease SbcCD ATPase subunit